MRIFRKTYLILFPSLLLFPNVVCSDGIKVRYAEGLAHGFLVLLTEDGTRIAQGEDSQVLRNGIVTNHLVFRFDDGSIYDGETRFTQHQTYKLLSDHLIQRGPSFPTQMETWIDTSTGHVTVSSSKEGQIETIDQKRDLPSDLANGMSFTIVKSLLSVPQCTVSYLAFAPKPKLVKLVFTQEGKETLHTDQATHEATRFLMKVEIGGIAGAMATITGKKPADTYLWVITGTAPSFAGSKGPLYGDGPLWRIELVSPRP